VKKPAAAEQSPDKMDTDLSECLEQITELLEQIIEQMPDPGPRYYDPDVYVCGKLMPWED